MRKKIYQNRNVIGRYYRKFCNLQKRVSLLMRSGEFYDLSHEIRHRLLRRLKLLYERIQRLAGKQKLKLAGAAMAMILSASVASAQFNDPVSLSGFNAGYLASPEFVDFDADGDLDIVIGDDDGYISYLMNDDGIYSRPPNPFSGIDAGDIANPAIVDVDADGDLDLVVGHYYGTLAYYENDGGTFTEMTGIDNPFDGINVAYESNPTFVNLDGDSDLDLVLGNFTGTITYYENDGGVFTELTGIDNPFDGVLVGYASSPGFVDYDDDGDMDLYVGDKYGTVFYYRNIEGVFTEQSGSNNPFNSIDLLDEKTNPVVLDVDDDGDYDLVIGDFYTQILRYFRNDEATYTEKRGTPNPFEGLLGVDGMVPAFSDMDNDGDLDVLVGEKYGSLKYFENTAEGFIPLSQDFEFDTIGASMARPIFADLDGDSDEDLIIGDYDGALHYFAKEGSNDFVELTGSNNPFDGIIAGGSMIYAAPAMVDYDDDGDLDLFVGGKTSFYPADAVGSILYFRNVSNVFDEQTGSANPFESIFVTDTVASGLNPAFIDIDRDGDLDAFIGAKYGGNILHFVNEEGVFTLAEGSENPLDGIILGYNPSPAFADLDEDGDLDLYLGVVDYYNAGKVYFFENTQGPPVAVPELPDQNIVIDIYSYGSTVVVDPGTLNLDRIEVYSLSGQKLRSADIDQQGRYELNIPDALPGLYIVRAYSDGVPTTEKVMLR